MLVDYYETGISTRQPNDSQPYFTAQHDPKKHEIISRLNQLLQEKQKQEKCKQGEKKAVPKQETKIYDAGPVSYTSTW